MMETTKSTTEIIDDLDALLQEISSIKGNFVCSSQLDAEMALPGLKIRNEITMTTEQDNDDDEAFTMMPLPIIFNEQAQQIIKIARKSPYGKLDQTLMDETVRKSWELEADQFQITNPMWLPKLRELLNTVIKPGLGIGEEKVIDCVLYKLLLYEEGGHFKFHKDSEKEEGMFASLVIQLPSVYSGGEIVVRHNEAEQRFNWCNKDSAIRSSFVSFYADCDHAVMPVTSGYRTCLLYNIVLRNVTSGIPQIFNSVEAARKMKNALQMWMEETDDEGGQNDYGPDNNDILVYLLEHEYTKESLAQVKSLKGNDYKIYKCLEESNLGFHIIPAMFVKIVRKGFSDDDSFIEGTAYEIQYAATKQNTMVPIRCVVSGQSVMPKNVSNYRLSGSNSHETGNYGTQESKWYKKSCLVMIKDEYGLVKLGSNYCLEYFKYLLTQYSTKEDENYEHCLDFFSFAMQSLLNSAEGVVWFGQFMNEKYKKITDLMIEINDVNFANIVMELAEVRYSFEHIKNMVAHFGSEHLSMANYAANVLASGRYDAYTWMESCYSVKLMEELVPIFQSKLEYCSSLINFITFCIRMEQTREVAYKLDLDKFKYTHN